MNGDAAMPPTIVLFVAVFAYISFGWTYWTYPLSFYVILSKSISSEICGSKVSFGETWNFLNEF